MDSRSKGLHPDTVKALHGLGGQPKFGEWQDITTAPRDGRWVLGCTAGYTPLMCKWDNGIFEWHPIDGKYHYEPTHWMPLPDPPENH